MATDALEAKALSYERDYIDIYSNSWGPGDKGFEVVGPDKLTQLALKDGAEKVHVNDEMLFLLHVISSISTVRLVRKGTREGTFLYRFLPLRCLAKERII